MRQMLFHVWFATRRRTWLLQDEIADACRELFVEIAERNGIHLIACEAVVDHVHMLLDLPVALDLARSMNLLKGGSSRSLALRFEDLRSDAGITGIWQAGYGRKVVPDGARDTVQKYIESQWTRLGEYDR